MHQQIKIKTDQRSFKEDSYFSKAI